MPAKLATEMGRLREIHEKPLQISSTLEPLTEPGYLNTYKTQVAP